MEASTIIALVFGTVAIISTLLGCTWKISGKMSGMENAVSTLIVKTDGTHNIISEHAADCDTNRAELDVKAKALAHTIDDHGHRIGKLETTG